jgi:hypothetical protein
VDESQFLKHLTVLVQKAGGELCGVQETMFPDVLSLIMFNSPATGSTLAVQFNPIDFDPDKLIEAIRTKIEASDAMFAGRSVSVKVIALQESANNLRRIADDIDLLITKEKKK